LLVEDNLFNMKSLNEEQKRMRKLMGFTYKDNSHDILSEQTINEAVNSSQCGISTNHFFLADRIEPMPHF